MAFFRGVLLIMLGYECTAETVPTEVDMSSSYIVATASLADAEALASAVEDLGGVITHRYSHAVYGFAANLTPESMNMLSHDPRVQILEANGMIAPTGTQTSAPWHLDDVDDTQDDGDYDYNATGDDVRVYVLDTGVRSTHNQLSPRVLAGHSVLGGTTADCHGHGTHMAGVIAGTTAGVAKDADIVPVRVITCAGAGSIADAISGLDWVENNAVLPAVANVSFATYGVSATLDAAAAAVIAADITLVASVENCTCSQSLARVSGVIGAYGSVSDASTSCPSCDVSACADFIAAGTSVVSAWYTSDSATNTLNGSSIAAAMVSGAAARHLQANPTDTPAQVLTALNGYATGTMCMIGGGYPALRIPDAL